MRTRRRLTWIIFGVCMLAVLEGLGYVTWHALRLERREREAQSAAQFQQLIRLALWRMESEVTPIIAAEAARPYFHYISFYPAERAYTKMFQQVKANEVLVPSTLLQTSGRFIRLHYQLDPDGRLSSPQAPTGNQRDLAEAQYLDSEYIVLAGQLLNEVDAMLRPALAQTASDRQLAAPAEPTRTGQTWQVEDSEFKARERAAQTAQTLNLNDAIRRKSQVERGEPPADATDKQTDRPAVTSAPASKETLATGAPRAAPAPTAKQPQPPEAATSRKDEASRPEADQSRVQSLLKQYQEAGPGGESRVEQGSLVARWYANPTSGEEELILERSVMIDGREVRQGVWIDWSDLRRQLKESIADLLPTASLSPWLDSANDAGGLRLAAIPVRLLPGSMPAVAAAFMTPTHITLIVTWGAVLGAIIAIGLVLRKAMDLSERRGRFVSAVTHELRTPLTTFCLYTEMLADGMVGDETARRHYLGTLKSESNRLARIVQNVLDYAGIGGIVRTRQGPQALIAASDLMERLRPAMELCASRSGMQLQVEAAGLGDAKLRADPQTIERIVLNLVENSGKYACDAPDKRIHVRAAVASVGSRRVLEIRVIDHGPGIPKSERRRVFEAFHRATRDAHSTKSGLGLGLALARELAAELGGRLTLNGRRTDGAEFILRIPLDT